MSILEDARSNYSVFLISRIHAQIVLTAVLTLFRFLIMIPTAPNFDGDLQIMDCTAEIFAEFTQSDDAERNCFPPFFLTHAFIKRLIFLAKQAHARSMDR
jgi:hypothetical protein